MLTAAATSTTSVGLTWKDTNSTAAGYNVLRSTNGKTYATIATLNSASANSYTDTTGMSGTTYDYEVEDFKSTTISNASNYAAATTKMAPVASKSATCHRADTTVRSDLDQQRFFGYWIQHPPRHRRRPF